MIVLIPDHCLSIYVPLEGSVVSVDDCSPELHCHYDSHDCIILCHILSTCGGYLYLL